MTRRAKQALQAIPLLQHDPVFLGIDVGKTRHVAGFVSQTLLERHQRFEACPALAFENSREGFQAIASASLSALQEVRGKTRFLTDAKLLDLQRLATTSIGTKDLLRQRGLLIEQTQLIRELRLLQEHIAQLEKEITTIVEQSREGQIVQSIGIGPVQTATILAAIGAIENFPKRCAASNRIVDGLQQWFSQGLPWIPPNKRVEAHVP